RYKFVLLGKSKGPIDAKDYEKLLQIEQAGGAVIVPKGFAPPADAKPLTKSFEWDPELVGESIAPGKGIKYAQGYAALQEHTTKGATHLRELLGRAGFKPYFDIESVEVVSRPYTYKGHAMLFVVNDKRVPGKVSFKEQADVVEPDPTGVIAPKNATAKKTD